MNYSSPINMDITKFVVEAREKALLLGDYSTYRSQLSGRIHNARKRLGRTTKKGAKYSKKAPVTAQDIASNHEYNSRNFRFNSITN
jgi:signal recognition particle subunit SRP68